MVAFHVESTIIARRDDFSALLPRMAGHPMRGPVCSDGLLFVNVVSDRCAA